MANTLSDLNNHLFNQLDRISKEELKGDELAQEIDRTNAMNSIAKNIVENAQLQLNAMKLKAEYKGLSSEDIPHLLEGKVGQ